MSLPVAARVVGGGGGRRIATGIDGTRVLVVGNDDPRAVECDGGSDWPMTQADADHVQSLYDAGGWFSVLVPGAHLGQDVTGEGCLLMPPEFSRISLTNHYRYKFTITLK